MNLAQKEKASVIVATLEKSDRLWSHANALIRRTMMSNKVVHASTNHKPPLCLQRQLSSIELAYLHTLPHH